MDLRSIEPVRLKISALSRKLTEFNSLKAPRRRKRTGALFCHQNVRLTHESGSGATPVMIPLMAHLLRAEAYGLSSKTPTGEPCPQDQYGLETTPCRKSGASGRRYCPLHFSAGKGIACLSRFDHGERAWNWTVQNSRWDNNGGAANLGRSANRKASALNSLGNTGSSPVRSTISPSVGFYRPTSTSRPVRAHMAYGATYSRPERREPFMGMPVSSPNVTNRHWYGLAGMPARI